MTMTSTMMPVFLARSSASVGSLDGSASGTPSTGDIATGTTVSAPSASLKVNEMKSKPRLTNICRSSVLVLSAEAMPFGLTITSAATYSLLS